MTDDGVGTNIPGSYTIEVPVYVVMSVFVIGFPLDTLTDPAHRGMVVSARDPPPLPRGVPSLLGIFIKYTGHDLMPGRGVSGGGDNPD